MSAAGSNADASLRGRLRALLETLDVELDPAPDDATPLVGSGLLDSLALVELAQWVEREVGRPLDPDAFDLHEEWATLGDLVRFIERQRAS